MIDFAAVSPPGINAGNGVWVQHRTARLPISLSPASRRQFPLISTRSNEKDPIQSFKVGAISHKHKAIPSNPQPRKERNPGRLSSSAASSKMIPGYLPIIRYPLGTESAMKAILEFNTLVFVVDKGADKNAIKNTVMEMFKVRAKKVNTLIRPDGSKKAFIMLEPGFSAVDVAKKIKFL